MSLYAIKEYRNEVEKIIHYGGTKKETARLSIAEKSNTYKFSDYKKKVIDLLKRVCTGNNEIINQMPQS